MYIILIPTTCKLSSSLPSAHLDLEEATAVGLEVAVIDLAHGVHILVSDLLSNRPLISQQELIEEPNSVQQGTK